MSSSKGTGRSTTTSTDSDGYIQIEGLEKTFEGGSLIAVEDFDLTINENEFVVFLGPSGCGKTTTLRCIAGLEDPDRGTILLNGEDITHDAPKDRDLAFVFQNITLFPHMTVRENMRFGLDMKTDQDADVKNESVEEAADVLDIRETLDRKPTALSGGQQQRVSIGRAMVMDPAAFLLDEPFANLDANLRDRMQTESKRLQRRIGKPMIFVTHDQEEAMTLGDKIVIMNNGNIQQVGDSYEIYNDPANEFVARFIGSPSTNMYESTVETRGDEVYVTNSLFDLRLSEEQTDLYTPADGDRVTLGIRPEYMHVVSEADALFTAEVEVKELHGEHDAIYFSSADYEFTVTEPQGEVVDIDAPLGVDIDRDQIWLFDEAGERLL